METYFFNQNFWSEPSNEGLLATNQEHYFRTIEKCYNHLDEVFHAYYHRYKDNPDVPFESLDCPDTIKAMIDVLYGVCPESVKNSEEKISYGEWLQNPENIASALLQALLHKLKGEMHELLEEKIEQLTINKQELENYGKQSI